jgi:ribonuclease E
MSDETPVAGVQNAPTPTSTPPGGAAAADKSESGAAPGTSSTSGAAKRRRRGSRGGRGRSGSGSGAATVADGDDGDVTGDLDVGVRPDGASGQPDPDREPELPDRASENRPRDRAVLDQAVVRKPRIGDSRPAPDRPQVGDARASAAPEAEPGTGVRRRRRGGRGRSRGASGGTGVRSGAASPVESMPYDRPIDLDEEEFERRRGKERNGRPLGRYLMCVHVQHTVDDDGNRHPFATQIAVLEGRALTEHYVSRPQDEISQIHGNVYLGRVQNVLPGMEAAFVDIGTPKNAVLYRGDVHYDPEDVESGAGSKRIEQILKAKQTILCQVTKNPISHKGARLTQEVSLPGRFVVLIPNSSTYGISKRLPDDERKRLRSILDKVKPAEHGVIVRTAAEGVTSEELERDVARLLRQWSDIDALAKRSPTPSLLYREPDMAVRIIREEFNADFRGVVIDDRHLFEEVRDYVASISPALADRVELYDPAVEALPLFERFHIHEQLHKALDRKVWLPSGGSLIIEHTEALTVIDINTGKNVGTSSLEETVFRNNLEAADEIARQLRLRDIGGIIVIDFIDMEIRENRDQVIRRFREALARDKTRTQVFDISDLGLVEMTRKRIGEGLLESFAAKCETCQGRGVVLDTNLLD